MDICKYCFKKKSIKNLEYHNSICIYYIYNTNYNKKISNKEIENIYYIISLFNLHKYKTTDVIDIKLIIKTLLIKNSFNENLLIYKIINYLLNYRIEFLSYNEILSLIEQLTFYSKNDIINIINSYKICYNNL